MSGYTTEVTSADPQICIKGPSVFQGYYKDEQKTREALEEDGWLHSGDIGKWMEDGTLKITDRKKHIFKLSQVSQREALSVLCTALACMSSEDHPP